MKTKDNKKNRKERTLLENMLICRSAPLECVIPLLLIHLNFRFSEFSLLHVVCGVSS
jgi:hypothetical protein